MAFRCDDCQYLYRKKRTSCPFCGGRVYNDSNSNESLLNAGFTWAPGQPQPSTDRINHSQNEQSQIEDPFESLRQDFFNEQQTATHSEPRSVPTVPPTPASKATAPSTTESPNDDFFSGAGTPSAPANNIPTVNPLAGQAQSFSVPNNNPDPYERELQELERQRQREERRYRRREVLNFFANIRWRTVFRILLIIAIIFAGITIWNMRYVILNSILNFIVALLPIILIIWIIYYLIRSLFR